MISHPSLRRRELFDDDWTFLEADAPGAENPAYDDTGSWTSIPTATQVSAMMCQPG